MLRIWSFCCSVSSRVPTSVQYPAQDFCLLTPSSFSFQKLFLDMASLCYAVIASSCEKILSIACMIHWWALWQWHQEPCEILIKPLTKTSTCAIGPQCLMSRAWSSGCGNGHGSSEIILAVIGLKGGCSPGMVSWGSPQQL